MAERKELAAVYIGQGITRDRALELLGISRHQYYYRPKAGMRGRKTTQTTERSTAGVVVDCHNREVVENISEIQKDPDTDYGYWKMAFQLMILGFIINHKKVYRLMQAAQLLKAKYMGSKYQ